MSLISEALKEAQRERSGRIPQKQPAAVGEVLFPYPSSKARRSNNRVMVIGAAGVVLLVIAGAVGLQQWRSSASRRTLTPLRTSPPSPTPGAAVSNPVPSGPVVSAAPAATSPTRTAPPESPAPAPVSTARDAVPRNVPPAQPSSGKTSAPAASPDVPKRAESSTPVPASPVASQKPVHDTLVAPAPLPRASRDAGIRVVADPTGLRSGDSLFARAYAEHARGNLEAAADLYEKALTRRPVSPELYNNYGALLSARGNQDAAVAMYKLGIEANQNDPRLWTNLGDSYRLMGRRADALSAYAMSAKLDPLSPQVKTRLAAEYSAIGDTATARRTYEDAVRAAPKDPETHYAFGSFLAAQRDYRGAVRELQAFVDNAGSRFPQDFVDRTKAYLSNIRRQYP